MIMLTNQTSNSIQSVYENMKYQTKGSISLAEAIYLSELFAKEKPKEIVEIGVASGLSSTILTKLGLQFQTDCSILSLDFSEKFYGDESKNVGFLAEEYLSSSEKEHLSIICKQTSFDLHNYYRQDRSVDFVFIDANHQHPWPTLDFLAVLPMCKMGTIVAFHDLSLHRQEGFLHGIGPKYLFDQFDRYQKQTTSDNKRNLFYLKIDRDYTAYEEQIVSSLYLPWSLSEMIEPALVSKIEDFIQNNWSETSLLSVFRENLKRYKHKLLKLKTSVKSFTIINGNKWSQISIGKGTLAKLILHPNAVQAKKQPMAVLKEVDIAAKKSITFHCCAMNQNVDNPGAVLTIKINGDFHQEINKLVLQPRIKAIKIINIPEGCSKCDIQVFVENHPNAVSNKCSAVSVNIL